VNNFTFLACSVAVALAASLLTGCATPPRPADRTQLAAVHTIFFEGIAEPPDRPFFEEAGGPPRSLLGRAHVGEDARKAMSAVLNREGYRVASDAKSADAVLSVNIETATYDADKPFHRDCKPSMLIAVKLRDLTGKAILQREYFYADVSDVPEVSGWLLLRADPKYTDPDCGKFSPELVMAAFHDVVPLLANAVGTELAKQ
jgi:hypothetical protein